MKTILLTGGAGYIGSHTAHILQEQGYRIVILDAFVHRQKCFVKNSIIIQGSINDTVLLNSIFQTYDIHAVMHFAGLIEVGISVTHPNQFYQTNVVGSLALFDCMRQYGVSLCVFSSTCAIYNMPQAGTKLDETSALSPASPYGKTKLAIEYVLQDYARAYGIRYVALRYFNAAGATPEHGLGENHDPETHVIPLLLRAARDNKIFTMYGNDYDTPDGSCVRDYVHVSDIARAHALALDYLHSGGLSDAFNLGTGNGYSVKGLIRTVQDITGLKISTATAARRNGDASTLVANPTKAQSCLQWHAVQSDISAIITSAWEWELLRNKSMQKSHQSIL